MTDPTPENSAPDSSETPTPTPTPPAPPSESSLVSVSSPEPFVVAQSETPCPNCGVPLTVSFNSNVPISSAFVPVVAPEIHPADEAARVLNNQVLWHAPKPSYPGEPADPGQNTEWSGSAEWPDVNLNGTPGVSGDWWPASAAEPAKPSLASRFFKRYPTAAPIIFAIVVLALFLLLIIGIKMFVSDDSSATLKPQAEVQSSAAAAAAAPFSSAQPAPAPPAASLPSQPVTAYGTFPVLMAVPVYSGANTGSVKVRTIQVGDKAVVYCSTMVEAVRWDKTDDGFIQDALVNTNGKAAPACP